jgi:N6-adenosine-specific RNA methylase IME4
MTILPPRVLLPVAGVPPTGARDSSLAHRDRAPLPSGPFEIIYADPPWHYYGDPTKDQAAGKHYRLLSTDEIARLPVREIAARRSVLFLWATSSKIPEALEVLKTWGYHYRGLAYVWMKVARDGHVINGQGIRPTLTKPTTEVVLAGTSNARGRVFPLLTEAQPQVLFAPRRRHSEKPSEIRDRIVELLGDRPRIELFARERVVGWEAWGDELPTDGAEPVDDSVAILRPRRGRGPRLTRRRNTATRRNPGDRWEAGLAS